MSTIAIQIIIAKIDLWLCQNASLLKFTFGAGIALAILAMIATKIKDKKEAGTHV